jgi:hypothetical protein
LGDPGVNIPSVVCISVAPRVGASFGRRILHTFAVQSDLRQGSRACAFEGRYLSESGPVSQRWLREQAAGSAFER